MWDIMTCVSNFNGLKELNYKKIFKNVLLRKSIETHQG